MGISRIAVTKLDFIRPGKPVENSYIESFNGRLRDECLNVEVFFTLADVHDKLERWRQDYNQVRPHSSLRDSAPALASRRNGQRPRQSGPGTSSSPGGKSPQRAIHWRYSVESVECKKRRSHRP